MITLLILTRLLVSIQSCFWFTESFMRTSGKISGKYVHQITISHYDLEVEKGKQILIIGHVAELIYQNIVVGQSMDFCLMRQRNLRGDFRLFADLDCRSLRRFI